MHFFQGNKPKPPEYLADLYTDEEWENYLLTIEMGATYVDVPFLVPVFHTVEIRALELCKSLELRLQQQIRPKGQEQEKEQEQEQPAAAPEDPAKIGAEELAKRIAERNPDLAIALLKVQRESDG